MSWAAADIETQFGFTVGKPGELPLPELLIDLRDWDESAENLRNFDRLLSMAEGVER